MYIPSKPRQKGTNMKVKHVVCPQKVLQAVTDLSLVRVCQERRVSVLSTDRGIWPIEELTIDAAQIELCRRYRPLIMSYANRSSTAMLTDDVESFLWIIFIESIYSFHTSGKVPFSGYVKAVIRYGYFNFYKQSARQWRHELTLPLCTGDDVSEPAMDQFPDDVDIERDIIGTVSEDELRNRLWAAFRKLPRQQQQLLYALYRDGKTCVDIGSETRQSRQAVQQRHQKAIDQLRYYMLVADNKEFDIQDMQNMYSYK